MLRLHSSFPSTSPRGETVPCCPCPPGWALHLLAPAFFAHLLVAAGLPRSNIPADRGRADIFAFPAALKDEAVTLAARRGPPFRMQATACRPVVAKPIRIDMSRIIGATVLLLVGT